MVLILFFFFFFFAFLIDYDSCLIAKSSAYCLACVHRQTALHFVLHYKCFFLPFIVRHTHRPDIVCDQPRKPWHLDYPQNLGWGSYYSIHLLVRNKLCRHPDLLCMLIYFSQNYSWLIGWIYIVTDTLTKSQTSFTASAVLIVTTVIFRLVAFCCYLRHISTISCHRHNPPNILNLGCYWCLMFTFTGYWYLRLQVASCQSLLCALSSFRLAILIGSMMHCYHVQFRMFGTASFLLFSILSDSGIDLRPTVIQWVFVRTSLYVRSISYLVHVL